MDNRQFTGLLDILVMAFYISRFRVDGGKGFSPPCTLRVESLMELRHSLKSLRASRLPSSGGSACRGRWQIAALDLGSIPREHCGVGNRLAAWAHGPHNVSVIYDKCRRVRCLAHLHIVCVSYDKCRRRMPCGKGGAFLCIVEGAASGFPARPLWRPPRA